MTTKASFAKGSLLQVCGSEAASVECEVGKTIFQALVISSRGRRKTSIITQAKTTVAFLQ